MQFLYSSVLYLDKNDYLCTAKKIKAQPAEGLRLFINIAEWSSW